MPAPTVYRMICNFQVFRDSRVQSLLSENHPTRIFSDWPNEAVPPAMLVLMMHENPHLRDWAMKQVSRSTSVSITRSDASLLQYGRALEMILLPFASGPEARSEATSIHLVTESATLWSSFHSVVRLLHPVHLTFFTSKGVDVRHVITGHLHDHGLGSFGSLQIYVLAHEPYGRI